jgi:uncharacterized protein YjgD (DUF1641 family)
MLIDFNYDTQPLPGKYPLPGVGPFSLLKETEMNHWGKLMFKWMYWNVLLPGKELPLPALMTMAGKEVVEGPALEAVTGRLAAADEKGYFAFARAGAGIADRVVTSFTEEDVEALGDNIVLILNTVKEMTQPEVMGMLRRTIHTVQDQDDTGEPPSMFALVKEMRDPQVRRGLARMLAALRSMGEER